MKKQRSAAEGKANGLRDLKKIKVFGILFGILHNLHYLCIVNIEERNKYESNNVNGQYL